MRWNGRAVRLARELRRVGKYELVTAVLKGLAGGFGLPACMGTGGRVVNGSRL